MSKYLSFDENGLPVDSFSQPKAAADSIFKTHEVKQENRLDVRGMSTAKASAMAQQLHALNRQENSSEPDWQGLLLQCVSGLEKMKVKEAKAAWQDEQKHKANLEVQAATDQRIAAIKTMPNRNKAFWENLRITDGRVFWSVEAQRQMKADKAALGLNFFSKK